MAIAGGTCNALLRNAIARSAWGAGASDAMMWRVCPGHGENAGIGKIKLSDLSHHTRIVAYSRSGLLPPVPLCSRCGPDQSPILLRSEKCHKLLALRLAFDDALQRMSMFAGKLHHLSCFCLGYFLRVGPQSPIPSL